MKNTIIGLILVFFMSCSKDEIKDFTAENDQEIQTYLSENNLSAQKSNSGLYYIIEDPGTGKSPLISDRVKVAYTGYYTNGTVFDESAEGISLFNLENVIKGWTEGITYFKEGGSGQLLIPSHLGYGSNENRGIPAGSVLIFDIELIYVNYITENDEEIQTYLTDNNITAEKTDSGLYYTTNGLGEGLQPTINDNITLAYKGYFTNDNIFDGGSENISFDLPNVIKGFSEGLTYFKEGDSGSLYIPSHLAYGNNGTPGIPGGAVLIFDVELISVN